MFDELNESVENFVKIFVDSGIVKTCDELDLAVDELVVLECVGSEPRSIFSSDSELLLVPVVEVLPVNLLVLKL